MCWKKGGPGMNWEEVRKDVQHAILSKVEEFQIYGFDQAEEDEVWQCLLKKKWKKDVEPKATRELVNDILGLSISDYMSFITINAFKEPFQFPST